MDAAADLIRKNENATRDLKKYIPKIEGAYTCLCAQCGKTYQSDNKRSAHCGC